MTEYFIGIVPPEEMYNDIINIQKKYISKLGVEPHITLKAQSNLTDDEQWIETVTKIIENTNQFEVKIEGTKYFGELVMFLSVISPELKTLHQSIVDELKVPDLLREKYFEGDRYIGHITVGKTTYPSGLSSNTLTWSELKLMEEEINASINTNHFLVDSVWIYKKEKNEYKRYKQILLHDNKEKNNQFKFISMEKDVPEVWIRSLDKKEYSIIKEFLYHAIYVPEGSKKPNKSIVDKKELLKYYEDFVRKDDYTMAAVINNRVIGLAWCRQFNETDKSYGFYKDDFVELNILILPDFRKQGLGKVLMEQLIYLLKNNNVNGISLSVTNGNYAQQLYKNIGFKPIAVRDEDTLMIKKL